MKHCPMLKEEEKNHQKEKKKKPQSYLIALLLYSAASGSDCPGLFSVSSTSLSLLSCS